MKKVYALILMCLIFSLVCFSGCGSDVSVDEQFKQDLMTGLSNRWDIADDGVGTKESYAECVASEYNMISEYKEADFENDQLGELAVAYIDVLERSNEAIGDFANEEKFYEEWDSIYSERCELLLELNEILDMQFTDEADIEEFEGFLSQGKVEKAVNEIIANTKFEKTKSDYGWDTYSAVVENTTDEDFDYFDFELKLIDAEGITVETNYATTENWNSGEKVKFEFSTDANFETMEIADCTYSF